jgi:hypothetical protein
MYGLRKNAVTDTYTAGSRIYSMEWDGRNGRRRDDAHGGGHVKGDAAQDDACAWPHAQCRCSSRLSLTPSLSLPWLDLLAQVVMLTVCAVLCCAKLCFAGRAWPLPRIASDEMGPSDMDGFVCACGRSSTCGCVDVWVLKVMRRRSTFTGSRGSTGASMWRERRARAGV